MLSPLLIEGGETAVAGTAFFGYILPRLLGGKRPKYPKPMRNANDWWRTPIQHRMDVDPDWQWQLMSKAYVEAAEWEALTTNSERNEYLERTFQTWREQKREGKKEMWSARTNIRCRTWNNDEWLASGTLSSDGDRYSSGRNTITLYFYARYQSPEEIEKEAREFARQIMSKEEAERAAKDARRRAEKAAENHEDDVEDALDIDIKRRDSRFMRSVQNYPLTVKGVTIGRLPPSPLLASIDDEDLLLKIFGDGDISPWAGNAMKRMETAFGINKRSVASLFGF